jgi:hypothetical protein
MKNTVLFSAYLILFTSCSFANDKVYVPINLDEINYKSMIDTTNQSKIKDTISNTYKKNNPTIDFITVGNLDIMLHDLGFFDSKQAEIACKKLGDGWRLPNEAELSVIYDNNEELGEFKTNYYLGMDSGSNAYEENVTIYLRVSIINGEVVLLQTDQELFSQYGVRAVRDHKPY